MVALGPLQVSGDHLVSWANSSLRFQKELPPIDSFVEGDLVSIRTSRPEPVSSRDGKGGRNYSREGGGRVVGGSPQPKKEIRAQPIAKSASEPDFTSLPTGDSERVHVMLCQLQVTRLRRQQPWPCFSNRNRVFQWKLLAWALTHVFPMLMLSRSLGHGWMSSSRTGSHPS